MGLFSSKSSTPVRYIPTDDEYNTLSDLLDSNDNLYDSLKFISWLMGVEYRNCIHNKYNNCDECSDIRLVLLPDNFEPYKLFVFNLYCTNGVVCIAPNTNNLIHLDKLKPCVEKMTRYIRTNRESLNQFSNGKVYISLFNEYLNLYNSYTNNVV